MLFFISFNLIAQPGWGKQKINEMKILSNDRASANTEEPYDLFPIAKGNKYIYNYRYSLTSYEVGNLDVMQNDSGKIFYTIIDSTLEGNKIDWLVEQKVDLSRQFYGFGYNDTLQVHIVNNFILNESLSGNHELTANPSTVDSTIAWEWGDIGIWKFPVNGPIPIYRFSDLPVFFVSNSAGSQWSIVDSLWFDSRGLYKRSYHTQYEGNHQIYTHARTNLDSIFTGIDNFITNLPENFYVSQNYPNPFNPGTTIEYSIPEPSNVIIKVFDLLGREVATLVNEEKPVGNYNVKFNGSNLASGIYFYRLEAGKFVQTKKLILLR